MSATLEALIGNGSLTAGPCFGADGRPTVVDGTPLGADMSGRTLKRAAAIDSVVAAPPGLGRETRAGCGAAGVRQLEAPLM
jgi:hypothetical protein